jgi:hypothetical protein
MASTLVVSIKLNVARTGISVNNKPYAVVKPAHGGSFCVFPKVGEPKAYEIVSGLKTGPQTLNNVGIGDGFILVYPDTVVSK